MQLKLLSLAAILGAAAAQETRSLNETLSSNPSLSNLTTFIGQFPNLIDQLSQSSNITLLAPSNEAFDKLLNSSLITELATNVQLLQAVLQYHVLDGTYYASNFTNTTTFIPTLLIGGDYSNVSGGQRVAAAVVDDNVTFFSALFQNSTVTEANLNFTGGTIHVINTVLSVPTNISSTAIAANLTSLYGALDDANLVDDVDDVEDVTVFAPINEAFQAIGSALQNISTQDLSNILTYHVVNGTVGYSSELSNGTTLQTLGGDNITIYIEDGDIFVNSAKVVIADVLVSNGVVHVIDNVLNPDATTASPSQNATAGAPAFSATPASDVPFTSDIPTPTSSIATQGGPPATGTASTTAATGAAMPMKTGAMAPAMLFGGAAAVIMNL